MRIFIKSAQLLIFTLLILGCKQKVTPEQWHDGSKGGVYGIGEGWSIEFLPPTYETFTEKVVVQEGIELVTIPAQFEWVKEDSEILKTYPKMVTKIVTIPATYMTITDNVVVTPAKTEYFMSDPIYYPGGTLKSPRSVIERHIPAQKRDVSRRVVKTPERTEERTVNLSLTPLERRDGYVRVVKTPSRTIPREVPDVYKTITKRREKHPVRFAIKNPDGELAHVFDTFKGLTTFTESLKQ